MLPVGLSFLPIPQEFWSAYLDAPFQQCIDCELALSDTPVYIIQKRIVGGEAVFEMAICEKCRGCLTETYSEETKAALTARMTEYFRARHARTSQRPADAGGPHAGEETRGGEESADNPRALLDLCMNYCLICERARETCHRYSLAGLFRMKDIVVQTSLIGQSPVMICDECERSLAGLISRKTREGWDRFMERHFDGPPGVDVEDPSYSPLAF